MRHPFRTIPLIIAAVALLTGCSWTKLFHVELTVVDAADGKPISGARARVDYSTGNEERKVLIDVSDDAAQTDEAGRLKYEFSIPGYSPTSSGGEHWYLKVKKEGYEPVVVDIKPNPPPELKLDEPIVVRVELKPAKEPPR